MVKALFLGLLIATMCGLLIVSGIPTNPTAPQIAPLHLNIERERSSAAVQQSHSLEDSATRSERSTNLSHITGTARKIQMFIKNRHLQLLPDGTVNGTSDDFSVYTILQRTTVGTGQLKIQGVATCQYLCMDGCGLLFGSRDFIDECVFNEMIEQHHYNTYSSTKYSNDRRTFYLALNRRGQSRKVLLRARQALGRLSSYTRVLTRNLAQERIDELHHIPPMRHHGHMCLGASSDSGGTSRLSASSEHTTNTEHTAVTSRCRRRRKRKKKKRKCSPEGDYEGELCHKRQIALATTVAATDQQKIKNKTLSNINNSNNNSSKKCETDESETDECQRVEKTIKKTKLKIKYSDKQISSSKGGKKKNHAKGVKNNHKKGKAQIPKGASTEVRVAPTTRTVGLSIPVTTLPVPVTALPVPVTALPITVTVVPVTDDNISDEDYAAMDSTTTAWEWEDSTIISTSLLDDSDIDTFHSHPTD